MQPVGDIKTSLGNRNKERHPGQEADTAPMEQVPEQLPTGQKPTVISLEF